MQSIDLEFVVKTKFSWNYFGYWSFMKEMETWTAIEIELVLKLFWNYFGLLNLDDTRIANLHYYNRKTTFLGTYNRDKILNYVGQWNLIENM